MARGAGELARRLSDLEISMGFFGKTGIMVNLGYPLVICYIEKNGKIHHFLWENTHYFGLGHGLTIAMLVITRG